VQRVLETCEPPAGVDKVVTFGLPSPPVNRCHCRSNLSSFSQGRCHSANLIPLRHSSKVAGTLLIKEAKLQICKKSPNLAQEQPEKERAKEVWKPPWPPPPLPAPSVTLIEALPCCRLTDIQSRPQRTLINRGKDNAAAGLKPPTQKQVSLIKAQGFAEYSAGDKSDRCSYRMGKPQWRRIVKKQSLAAIDWQFGGEWFTSCCFDTDKKLDKWCTQYSESIYLVRFSNTSSDCPPTSIKDTADQLMLQAQSATDQLMLVTVKISMKVEATERFPLGTRVAQPCKASSQDVTLALLARNDTNRHCCLYSIVELLNRCKIEQARAANELLLLISVRTDSRRQLMERHPMHAAAASPFTSDQIFCTSLHRSGASFAPGPKSRLDHIFLQCNKNRKDAEDCASKNSTPESKVGTLRMLITEVRTNLWRQKEDTEPMFRRLAVSFPNERVTLKELPKMLTTRISSAKETHCSTSSQQTQASIQGKAKKDVSTSGRHQVSMQDSLVAKLGSRAPRLLALGNDFIGIRLRASHPTPVPSLNPAQSKVIVVLSSSTTDYRRHETNQQKPKTRGSWRDTLARSKSTITDHHVSYSTPEIAVLSATHAMWTTMSASPRIISVILLAILFLHFIAKTRNHVDDLTEAAKVHISMSPCRAQRRIRASYNKLIARTCRRNRIWHRMLLTIFCAIFMLHADVTTTCHPSLFTYLLAIKRGRNRNKHRTRLNQQEKLLICNIDSHLHAAMDLIHITYAHLKNYILLTNFDAWTTCMWIRRAGPLSIILKVQRIFLIDTCVSILMSMMLTLTLYLVYRAAQDYTGALFDRLHSMSPYIGSVITEADMIINQSLFKAILLIAILLIKQTHVLLLGRDGTKPYNFRDIAPLSDKILLCASTCSNYISAYLLAILLLRGGDIHPNPGQPTPEKDPQNQRTKI
jgi:hypothetical protein